MLHKAESFESKAKPKTRKRRQDKRAEDAKKANNLFNILSGMKSP